MAKGYTSDGKRISASTHARRSWTCVCGNQVEDGDVADGLLAEVESLREEVRAAMVTIRDGEGSNQEVLNQVYAQLAGTGVTRGRSEMAQELAGLAGADGAERRVSEKALTSARELLYELSDSALAAGHVEEGDGRGGVDISWSGPRQARVYIDVDGEIDLLIEETTRDIFFETEFRVSEAAARVNRLIEGTSTEADRALVARLLEHGVARIRSLSERAGGGDTTAAQEIWELADTLHNAGYWLINPWVAGDGTRRASSRLIDFARSESVIAWLGEELRAAGRNDLITWEPTITA